MYHSFLLHSSADGHLGCFHVLAIINSAVTNIEVHVSLSILVSSVCMPSNGMDFQAVAKSHHVRAPRERMQILASRPSIQMCAQDIFPTGSKNVPDRPKLTNSPAEEMKYCC